MLIPASAHEPVMDVGFSYPWSYELSSGELDVIAGGMSGKIGDLKSNQNPLACSLRCSFDPNKNCRF